MLGDKTPHKVAGHGKLDLSDLHEFGTTIYVLVEGRKLDPKGKEARFVGYDQERKGYHVYWPDKRTVTVERNVIFRPNEVAVPEGIQSEGVRTGEPEKIAQNAQVRTKQPDLPTTPDPPPSPTENEVEDQQQHPA